jgi:aminoglycoside phosphotransferase (APT) family kinase protein
VTSINPPVCHADTLQVIRQAFGGSMDLMAAVPLPGGQINATSLTILENGDRLILRAAPSEADASASPSWLTSRGLRREAAAISAMPDLAHLLPVTVAHSFEDNFLGRDWVMQQVMPGVPLSTVDSSLEPDTRASIWKEVGSFTRQMHDHSCAAFGPTGEDGFENWTGLLTSDAAGLLDDAQRFSLPAAPFERLVRLIADHTATLDDIGPPALIHSDLLPPHIFVTDDDDGELHLGGVIDLEFARYADRASEHVLPEFGLGYVPTEMRDAFNDGYDANGPIEERPGHEFRRAVYLALGIGWNASLVAFQQGDPSDLVADLETALADAEKLASGD